MYGVVMCKRNPQTALNSPADEVRYPLWSVVPRVRLDGANNLSTLTWIRIHNTALWKKCVSHYFTRVYTSDLVNKCKELALIDDITANSLCFVEG